MCSWLPTSSCMQCEWHALKTRGVQRERLSICCCCLAAHPDMWLAAFPCLACSMNFARPDLPLQKVADRKAPLLLACWQTAHLHTLQESLHAHIAMFKSITSGVHYSCWWLISGVVKALCVMLHHFICSQWSSIWGCWEQRRHKRWSCRGGGAIQCLCRRPGSFPGHVKGECTCTGCCHGETYGSTCLSKVRVHAQAVAKGKLREAVASMHHNWHSTVAEARCLGSNALMSAEHCSCSLRLP